MGRWPAWALVACVSTGASAATVLTRLTDFQERLESSVPVSGSTLVGVLRGDASGSLTIDRLAVDVPAGASGALCIDMATRDGRYSAWQNFRVASATGTAVDLNIRSVRQQRGDLRQYAARDLAVRAQLRADCESGGPGRYVAARWNDRPPSDRLAVLVNVKLSSARAVLLDAAGRAVTGEPVACASIEGGSRTAYDHQCPVVLPAGRAGTVRTLRLEITGTTGTRRVESYPLGLI